MSHAHWFAKGLPSSGSSLGRGLVPLWGLPLAFACFTSSLHTAGAQAIQKIEEDWTLAVHEPDSANHSPQVNLFVSPRDTDGTKYFQLQLNHAADDTFSGGGFQLVAIERETVVEAVRSDSRTAIFASSDRVVWTQRMEVCNGQYSFSIVSGTSGAWGNFGGSKYSVRLPADPSLTLDRYNPRQSFEAADISFGRNRVASLTLHRVRLYFSDGSSKEEPLELTLQ